MARANEVKRRLEAAYEARVEVVRQAQIQRELEAGALDVTLPGRPVGPGHLHITTQTLRRIYAIFAEMGFQVYEARDVETDEMNFGLLNMPPITPHGICGTPSGSPTRCSCGPTRLPDRFG